MHTVCSCVRVCVCVCVCVRARAHACMRARVSVCTYACACRHLLRFLICLSVMIVICIQISKHITMSHHHTYYVTSSSYILCHIIILYIVICIQISKLDANVSRWTTLGFWWSSQGTSKDTHSLSHHHTYYVTSSYILCHIIILGFWWSCKGT